MRMAMATQVEVGGTVMPTPTPPTLVATVEYRVEQIAANGNITLSFVYTDVRAEPAAGQSPEMAAAFARAARNLVGIGGRLVSTPTGTISGLEVIVPPDLDPQLAQAMGTLQQTFEQVSFPLPSAPVGPQAQWQHCSTFDAGVLALDQAATYTVQSMRGDRVQLGIDIQQTADPQPFQLPGFPGSARLDALDSVGSGSVTLDLTRMAPQQLALETRSRQQISMTDPNAGRSEQIAVLSTVRLTVTDSALSSGRARLPVLPQPRRRIRVPKANALARTPAANISHPPASEVRRSRLEGSIALA